METETPFPEAEKQGVEAYTKLRRRTLRSLLVGLIRRGKLTEQDLETVIDLGSYEGSSTMALRDVGANTVISVDKNQRALETGGKVGSIENPVVSDMTDYIARMDRNFHGTITALNCILYLPENKIYCMIDDLSDKLAPNSKFVFTFSKTQKDWIPKFAKALSTDFLTVQLTGIVSGELDYNCFVATKK